MASIEKTVFISYRRKDISWALAVYQYLTNKNYDVFFDYTSIRSGDFAQIIASNIRGRAHFLLILTPTSLDRYSEPNDWLKREIETAIDEKRNIIPLFFEGFSFNSPGVAQKLTGKLSLITHYNGLDIPAGYFMEAMERLSEKYLDVPLDAVIHPVSTEIRTASEKEQRAVNQALEQKRADIEELVKPAETPFIPSKWVGGESQLSKLRLFGIGALILFAGAFAIAGVNFLYQNSNSLKPTDAPRASPVSFSLTITQTPFPTRTLLVEPTRTAPPSPTSSSNARTKTSPKDGMVLVFIPAGKFMMGSNTGLADQQPVHEVTLDPFWMDQTEVTNSMYAKCVDVGTCKVPAKVESQTHTIYYGNSQFDSYPVIYVDWYSAKTYCEWVDRRLPTESEWEMAARGEDGRTYPWGNEPPNNNLLNYNSAVGDTVKVGTYPSGASPYGVLDFAGNVWEWVADRYDGSYYSVAPTANPKGPDLGGKRVLRGGSWHGTADLIQSTLRRGDSPSWEDQYLGFRCAASE